jgi:hypothetical protein
MAIRLEAVPAIQAERIPCSGNLLARSPEDGGCQGVVPAREETGTKAYPQEETSDRTHRGEEWSRRASGREGEVPPIRATLKLRERWSLQKSEEEATAARDSEVDGRERSPADPAIGRRSGVT